MADLVKVSWYATILRLDYLAGEVAKVAPHALRYGATQYAVHVDNDDRYKIFQMTWVPDKTTWYRFWDGPEMIEFRARNLGKYQIPIVYSWADEIAAGELGPQVPNGDSAPEPAPAQPESTAV